MFEAIPLFVDSFGSLVRLRWEFLYKGSVRDFYPTPSDQDPLVPILCYAEQFEARPSRSEDWKVAIGQPLAWEDLAAEIDFAFLALHGRGGEDGTVQSMLEYFQIPYTGSGPMAAAWGMDKQRQRQDMVRDGWPVPSFKVVDRSQWVGAGGTQRQALVRELMATFPGGCVVKAAHQGSSIGLTVCRQPHQKDLEQALDKAFFCLKVHRPTLIQEGTAALESMADFRNGPGFPLRDLNSGEVWYHPPTWWKWLNESCSQEDLYYEALDGESSVLVEEWLDGKEFSCIVLEKGDGTAAALPPTGIETEQGFYDYRSKYLPGLARKKTPIDLPDSQIQAIRKACVELFQHYSLEVYARIDGFVLRDGRILLNDPNTTSGMMPSSFFFQQAAEIGLDPSHFLTCLIGLSLKARLRQHPGWEQTRQLALRLDHFLENRNQEGRNALRVGVLMGGFSSERHISVESGRNIYEKLSSMEGMQPVSLFLSGCAAQWNLHQLPMYLHLKDHADDVLKGLEDAARPEILQHIQSEFADLWTRYAPYRLSEPREIPWEELPQWIDFVFVALHGRPGEDGAIQTRLEALNIPYNGSGPESSALTIDKYATGRLLDAHGLSVAKQRVVRAHEWPLEVESLVSSLSGAWPLIAKPLDDGCSTAVCRLANPEDLEAYAALCFRKAVDWPEEAAKRLGILVPELFTPSDQFLLEQYIHAKPGETVMEVTGAMLVRTLTDGSKVYEVFQPSESIAGAGILSLEEKFLAGQGTNITPARFATNPEEQDRIMTEVQKVLQKAAECTGVTGYCRIDAFVCRGSGEDLRVFVIEINSLPGMTPATCIYHQAALAGYTPHAFIAEIIALGRARHAAQHATAATSAASGSSAASLVKAKS